MLKLINLNFSAYKKNVLLPICVILVFSILSLYSSSGNFYPYVYKQIKYILISFIVFCVIVSINIKVFYNFAYICLLFICICLIAIFPLGKNVFGSSRWLDFGVIAFQPSELAKIAVILSVSRFLSNSKPNILTAFRTILLISPAVLLIATQPDLSTSIIITLISCILIFFAIKIKKRYYIIIGSTLFISIVIIWTKFLKQYQKLRIITFLYPNKDPLGSGYNIIQSKIAIGSGGLFGKGFLKNTQQKLKFLPENHTDFVFTSICEQFGFVASCLIIAMYLWIVYYGIMVAEKSNVIFNKLLAIGCTNLIFLHFIINTFMVSGLLPVSGIPLIFISYGGSNLMLGFICIAILINIDLNNSKKEYV